MYNLNSKILNAPGNATFAPMRAFIDAKPDRRTDVHRRTVVRPYGGMGGGQMDGHYVVARSASMIEWVMHRTVVARWHDDGRRELCGIDWADKRGTRDVWWHLLRANVSQIKPSRRDYVWCTMRLATNDPTLPFGIPLDDADIEVDSLGHGILADGATERVRITDAAIAKVAKADRREFLKFVASASAVMAQPPCESTSNNDRIQRHALAMAASHRDGDPIGVVKGIAALGALGVRMQDVRAVVGNTCGQSRWLDGAGAYSFECLPAREAQQVLS